MIDRDFRIEDDGPKVGRRNISLRVSAKGPMVDIEVRSGRYRFHMPLSPDEAHEIANAIHSAADDAEDYRGDWDV